MTSNIFCKHLIFNPPILFHIISYPNILCTFILSFPTDFKDTTTSYCQSYPLVIYQTINSAYTSFLFQQFLYFQHEQDIRKIFFLSLTDNFEVLYNYYGH